MTGNINWKNKSGDHATDVGKDKSPRLLVSCHSSASTTVNCVCQCNRAFHAETLHPLVSLIDMSSPCERGRVKTDCYAVVFRHNAGDGAKYGLRPCDFTDGTLLFVTPSKEIDLATADGKMLVFHPSLTECTPLGLRLKEYSFFKYRQDESLHISCCEEKVIKRCLGCISDELCWGVDDYSKDIISNAIDLLLGYCRRFYRRQFITRHELNADALNALDGAIDGYFKSGRAAICGLPTASRLATRLRIGRIHERHAQERDRQDHRRVHTAAPHVIGKAAAPGHRHDRRRHSRALGLLDGRLLRHRVQKGYWLHARRVQVKLTGRDGLSRCERPSFASRKAVFDNAKDGLLVCKR